MKNTPECYVIVNGRYGNSNSYFPARVVKETKTTISVECEYRQGTIFVFNKIKYYPDEILDPRDLKERSGDASVLSERGERYSSFKLTFDIEYVKERIAKQKQYVRDNALKSAKSSLVEIEETLVKQGRYQPSDEVYECLQKLKAAIESDLNPSS